MQDDRFSELILEALVCQDEQQKEAILQEVYKIEIERLKNSEVPSQPERPLLHYDISKFTGMVDGDYEPPYEINPKTDEVD